MDILKLTALITVAFLFHSQNAYADDQNQDSKWLVGGGVSTTSFVERGCTCSLFASQTVTDKGFDFHVGRELLWNSKLTLGYRSISSESEKSFTCGSFTGECTDSDFSDKLRSFYVNFRPHWAISEYFLLYGEVGLNNYNRKDSQSELTYTDMSRTTLVENKSSEFSENNSKIGLSWGFGAVFRLGNHDLSLGFINYSIGDLHYVDALSALSLQYDYHFDF